MLAQKITGLPNVDKANFDLVINQFETARDLNSFVPKDLILVAFNFQTLLTL
jgi:hypothetical protein